MPARRSARRSASISRLLNLYLNFGKLLNLASGKMLVVNLPFDSVISILPKTVQNLMFFIVILAANKFDQNSVFHLHFVPL
jgi:hypothetical protein